MRRSILLSTVTAVALSFATGSAFAQSGSPGATPSGGAPAATAVSGSNGGEGSGTAGGKVHAPPAARSGQAAKSGQLADPAAGAPGHAAQPAGTAQQPDAGRAAAKEGGAATAMPATGQGQKAGSAREATGSIGHGTDLSSEQRVQVTKTFSSVKVQPERSVNFTVAAGTMVPAAVELHVMPVEIVRVVPAWRTYRYIVVQNEIVIIEPGTRKIVAVLDRAG